uniref:Hydroxysteroid dehydrogenase-like protein 2 n=1 Tax=Anopheles epiroticus TaxID=199890 RepID=A0A182PLF1_9DIPT
MINTGKLAGRTLFITGASRGIGKAIALRAAQDGANVVVAAKTADPHPKLPGTIYTAAKEIEAVGGKALPCVVDVRDEAAVRTAVQNAVAKFGGIDIVVNNASAISLTPTEQTEMKRFDLMHQINTRGTFLVSKECIPYLRKSNHAHILNISPPLNMAPHWFSNHVAYTMAKYGMSMCVLGMAKELESANIAVNALWPRTAIHTAAMEMLTGKESDQFSRKPEIMADAAYAILSKEPRLVTGKFLIDDEVLKAEGITDMKQYACVPENADKLMPDFFLDVEPEKLVEFAAEGSHAASLKKPAGDAAGGKIEGLFQKIESLLSEEIVRKTGAVYEFKVKGEEAGTWFADLKNGTGKVGKGNPPATADAVLTMDSKHFFDMFTGKLKPANAFMTGKLKISGDLQKAMKLEKLMGGLKSKLKLAGITLFITGASRGIGKAIALKAARDGANIVLAAKTAEPHPKLPGTIYTAAKEIEAAGGKALPCIVDVRSEQDVRAAVQKAVQTFGGIDIVVNNASAISLTPTEETDMKRYDLMHNINTRGTFLVSKECLPYLRKSKHAHILNISPPLNMEPHWFSNHVAYTMAKYGMSMCVLGMAREYESAKISVNALWPRTIVYTAAVEMLHGQEGFPFSRKPEIMADAAYAILCRPPGTSTGNFFIDDEVLTEEGVKDLAQYACVPGNALILTPDIFVNEKKSKL